jgi:nitrogen fixation protein FixH
MSGSATDRRGPRSPWDWFPWAVAASLVVVIVINAGMIWAALATFPGQAGPDGFDLSNHYNAVLLAAARQQALGWKLGFGLGGDDHLVLRLAGPGGRPLAGVTAEAEAERPVGPRETRRFRLIPVAPGRWRSAAVLPRGLWQVALTLRAEGHLYSERKRIIVAEPPRPAR